MKEFEGVKPAKFQLGKLLINPKYKERVINRLLNEGYCRTHGKAELMATMIGKRGISIIKKSKIVIYESLTPQEYTFEDVKRLLKSEESYEKLNYGERLNCVRAFAAECCKDLNINQPQIYLADQSKSDVPENQGSFYQDTDIITFNILNSAAGMKITVPHEIRHYYQDLVSYGVIKTDQPNNFKPPKASKAQCKKTVKKWKHGLELDGDIYALDFNKRHFPRHSGIPQLRFFIMLANGVKPKRLKVVKATFKKRKAFEDGNHPNSDIIQK